MSFLCPWDSAGKNTGVDCHSLLQGIFSTQGLNLHSLQWKHHLNHLTTRKSPRACLSKGSDFLLWYSCLENPMDGGAWWAAVHGVARSRTQLSDFTFTFMHWRRKWQPTPVLLPGESQGRGSLAGCRLWGRTELDTTEVT